MWEQKEKFLEEAEELAMSLTVSYACHEILAELYGYQKYLTLISKHYVPPVRPPVIHPSIVAANLSQHNARIAEAENNQAKVDCAVLEGFWSGFGENFRKAFDKKYYKQLYEDTFRYRRRLPREYIQHLQNRWVKVDTIVIKHLKNNYSCRWEEDKHIILFRVRLEREQKKIVELEPTIQILDDDIKQHYLEETIKRANYFGQKRVTEFEDLPTIQKQWPAPATHYKKNASRTTVSTAVLYLT